MSAKYWKKHMTIGFFERAPRILIQRLSGPLLKTYLGIAQRCGKRTRTAVPWGTIAHDLGINEDTIIRHAKQLVNIGVLQLQCLTGGRRVVKILADLKDVFPETDLRKKLPTYGKLHKEINKALFGDEDSSEGGVTCQNEGSLPAKIQGCTPAGSLPALVRVAYPHPCGEPTRISADEIDPKPLPSKGLTGSVDEVVHEVIDESIDEVRAHDARTQTAAGTKTPPETSAGEVTGTTSGLCKAVSPLPAKVCHNVMAGSMLGPDVQSGFPEMVSVPSSPAPREVPPLTPPVEDPDDDPYAGPLPTPVSPPVRLRRPSNQLDGTDKGLTRGHAPKKKIGVPSSDLGVDVEDNITALGVWGLFQAYVETIYPEYTPPAKATGRELGNAKTLLKEYSISNIKGLFKETINAWRAICETWPSVAKGPIPTFYAAFTLRRDLVPVVQSGEHVTTRSNRWSGPSKKAEGRVGWDAIRTKRQFLE